jgi:hypothetical protein
MNNDKSISVPLCFEFHIFSINARAWLFLAYFYKLSKLIFTSMALLQGSGLLFCNHPPNRTTCGEEMLPIKALLKEQVEVEQVEQVEVLNMLFYFLLLSH